MKKGKVVVAVAVALFMVVAIGIALASVVPNGCYCIGGCYNCVLGNCTMTDDAGGCFCTTNPCSLGHWACCKAS